MTKVWFAMGAVVFALGCDGGKETGDTSGGEAGGDGGGGGGSTPSVSASASWGSSSLDVTISNGSGSYEFGVAETAGCGSECWTGEDCLNGYALEDGSVLLYCHSLGDTGGSLAYGGSATALDEGSETLFPDNSYDGAVTYYLGQGSDCWVWGDSVGYYSGLGCENPSW